MCLSVDPHETSVTLTAVRYTRSQPSDLRGSIYLFFSSFIHRSSSVVKASSPVPLPTVSMPGPCHLVQVHQVGSSKPHYMTIVGIARPTARRTTTLHGSTNDQQPLSLPSSLTKNSLASPRFIWPITCEASLASHSSFHLVQSFQLPEVQRQGCPSWDGLCPYRTALTPEPPSWLPCLCPFS